MNRSLAPLAFVTDFAPETLTETAAEFGIGRCGRTQRVEVRHDVVRQASR